MISFIIFFLGIFALYKGTFRVFGRTVTRSQGRVIGLILMAPLSIMFCAWLLIMPNYLQFGADGTVGWDINALATTADQLSIMELITVFLALALVLINIFNAPQGTATDVSSQPQPQAPNPFRTQAPPPPAPVPNIMTVAEAANYMRVSESDVLDLINGGKLAAARIGDSYRIARIAIEDFLNPTP